MLKKKSDSTHVEMNLDGAMPLSTKTAPTTKTVSSTKNEGAVVPLSEISPTAVGFAKSFNRANDVLANTPLRSPLWLATANEKDDIDKNILAETWIARLFQHVKGMKQADYDDFIQKLFIRQLDWIPQVVSRVPASFFSTLDITPHRHNFHDLFWSHHPKTPEGAWLRQLWLGREEEKLEALRNWVRHIDPKSAVLFGNVLPAVATRASQLPSANDQHQRAAAAICNWVGEGGIKSDKLTTDQPYRVHQDLGYFGQYVPVVTSTLKPDDPALVGLKPTKDEVRFLLENSTDIATPLMATWLPCYVANIVTDGETGVEVVDNTQLLGAACSGGLGLTVYRVLETWLPRERHLISQGEKNGQDYWEICSAIKEKYTERVQPEEMPDQEESGFNLI